MRGACRLSTAGIRREMALRIAYNPTYRTAVGGPTRATQARYADSVISGMLHFRISLPGWAGLLWVTWVPGEDIGAHRVVLGPALVLRPARGRAARCSA